jgi:hypothetical protein
MDLSRDRESRRSRDRKVYARGLLTHNMKLVSIVGVEQEGAIATTIASAPRGSALLPFTASRLHHSSCTGFLRRAQLLLLFLAPSLDCT